MKYKLTDEITEHNGRMLYRIQALKDFGNVKAGNFGGWIESEKNLSHDDNCWVADEAKVFDTARISGDALVFGNAEIFDSAEIFGDAWVFGNTWIFRNTQIKDGNIGQEKI